MPRQRMVKPQFFTHYELYEAEQQSGLPLRLAYEGLWCVADREGRFEWKPPVLKLDILPYDTVDFGAVLAALERAGFIRSYEIGSRRFGVIPTFSRHQNPHVKEAQSLIPPPPEANGNGHRESTGKAPGKHGAGNPTSRAESEYGIRNTESVEEHVEFAPEKHGAHSTGVAVVVADSVPPNNSLTPAVRVLSDVAQTAKKRVKADEARSEAAEFVFAYWALTMQRPRVLFDEKRKARIEGALRQNKGDVSELLYAIDGAKRTPFLMGENDRQQKYDGIETILRDRAQIEKLASKMPGYTKGEIHPRVAELGAA